MSEIWTRGWEEGWEGWGIENGLGASQKCHPIRTSVHILEPEFDILATYLSCVKHFSDRERRKVALFPGTVHFLLSK